MSNIYLEAASATMSFLVFFVVPLLLFFGIPFIKKLRKAIPKDRSDHLKLADRTIIEDVTRARLFHKIVLFVNNPQLIHKVLLSDVFLEKPHMIYKLVFLDSGLLTSRCEFLTLPGVWYE